MKFLPLEDEDTRQSLAIDVGRSFKTLLVREALAKVIAERGALADMRIDNRPEFIAMKVAVRLKDQSIGTHLLVPGKPWQKGFEGSINTRFRDECLSGKTYDGFAVARVIAKAFKPRLQRATSPFLPGPSHTQRIRRLLRFLHAVAQPGFSFICMDAATIKMGYAVPLSEADATFQALEQPENALILLLVSVPEDLSRITATLAGSLVINKNTLWGRQVILNSPDC